MKTLTLCAVILGWWFTANVVAQQNLELTVNFREQIQPLLARSCYACHGPDANQRKADLRLDQEEGAKDQVIIPADSEASELIARIFSDDAGDMMPPPESGHPLSDAEKQSIKRWVEQGAAWQSHWAFEPIASPKVPITGADWARNEIDRFVFRAHEQQKYSPSAPANKSTLLRRVTLDLTGLPPTPSQLTAFLQDESPEAFENVVDRLLASKHYGEQMAVAWLDAARFADTNGYQNDFVRHMWPWRDWVIESFNQNLPYDDFIVQQIAGDLLPSPTEQQLIATGFNRNNRSVTEGGSIEEEWRIENCVDRVETTSATFLGLTMGCCRCHDHKYDPISQQEFFEFFAFFNNVDEQGFYGEKRGNFGPIYTFTTPEKDQELETLIGSLGTLNQRLKEVETAIVQQQNAEKEAKVAAEQEVEKDTPEPAAAEKPEPSEDPLQPAAEKEQIIKQLRELRSRRRKLENSRPTSMVMRDRPEYRETFLLKRGQYDQPDQERGPLFPAIPAALPPLTDDQPRNRLGLAKWMVDSRNPLVARVAVNQAWLKFFGRGLVESSDNFGVQGSPPSHPDLLDWLAHDFREHDWDLKRIQKMIVMSATYQQSSESDAQSRRQDLENICLARGPRYRLSAEQVRDQALAVAGLLVEKIGGPSVFPYQPAGLWNELAGGGNNGPYRQSTGDDLYRRSLYTYRKRTVLHPTLATFGAPSWEICQIQRARTNTPLQSLALLNDVTYVESARKLAERMLRKANESVLTDRSQPIVPIGLPEEVVDANIPNMNEAIGYGFTLTHLREPTQKQMKTLEDGFTEYLDYYLSHPEDAQQLIAVGESSHDESLPAARLAAMTSVATILLNLDEVISKE